MHANNSWSRGLLPSRSPSLVVADFGCGDCKIARSVKNKVHSFDLAAVCELVTVCDMAKVSGFLSCRLIWPAALWNCEEIRHARAPPRCRCHSATPPWTSPCSACPSWEPTWRTFWQRPTVSWRWGKTDRTDSSCLLSPSVANITLCVTVVQWCSFSS